MYLFSWKIIALQYCVNMVSGVHQHELTQVHICPLPLKPAPPRPVRRLWLSQSARLSRLRPHGESTPPVSLHLFAHMRLHAALSMGPTLSFPLCPQVNIN